MGWVGALALGAVAIVGGCDRDSGKGGAAMPATASGGVRIASLVPAATDMLIGRGGREQLVAVSNFDTAPETKDLPRVGDYQTTDWEMLARLRPDVMIIQIAPERVPPGMVKNAENLGIKLENVSIHRLEDVFTTMRSLGKISGQPGKAEETARLLREKLDAVRKSAAGRPAVKVLMFHDANGRDVIGPDNFLDDLLKVVNATNAAGDLGHPYPSIDREKLSALAPEAVIVLMPDAAGQTIEQARQFWASMSQVPAVRDGRVHYVTERYALIPGSHVGELAEKLAGMIGK